MKRILFFLIFLPVSVAVYGQGTVNFNNHVAGVVITHVYETNRSAVRIGNGPTDFPAGATDWTTFQPVSGSPGNGLNQFLATLLVANGADQVEQVLRQDGSLTTFRTGAAAGEVFAVTDTLLSIPPDSAVVTMEMVAWDNSSGLYSTWNSASVAWADGLIAAGRSPKFNLHNIGGNVNFPPNLTNLASFNVYPIGVCPGTSVTPTNLPAGVVGTAYSAPLTAVGCLDDSCHLVVPSGGYTLPPGLTWDGTAISGTPSQGGVFNFLAEVRETACSTYQQYSITIAPAYTLSLPTNGNGTATANPPQAYYAPGTAVTLTATPSAYWTFTGWSGDTNASLNPLTITMDANKTIAANFARTAILVVNNSDAGVGSLREAIAISATNHVPIIFAPSLTGQIALNSELDITNNLTITGPGATNLTVDGGGAFPVFIITNGNVNISGLTIAHGLGGIVSSNASVTVSNCCITGHTVHGIFNGTNGTMVLVGCTIASNSVSGQTPRGGGIQNATLTSTLVLTNCTVSSNSCIASSGVGSGGAIQSLGPLTILSSTICSNVTARISGGVAINGGVSASGSLLTIGNSIVVGNSSANGGMSDFSATGLGSLGCNLIGITNGSTGWVPSDLAGNTTTPLDPKLGPLQNNGGPTPTHALLASSPAIDAGKSFGVTTDQRGSPRPLIFSGILNGGDGSDIGAFEVLPSYTLTISTNGSGTVTKNPVQSSYAAGTPVTLTATASAGWSFSNWSGSTNTTTNPLTITMDGNKAITANFASACDPPPGGLVAWWRAENNANDSVGNNNGTLMNGATFAMGEVGGAFSLDGVNDYISVPHNAMFNFSNGITIEAWLKTANSANTYIITKGEDSFFLSLGGGLSNNKLAFYLYGVSGDWLRGTSDLNDGQWHHVAATYDGSAQKIYVDGVMQNSTGGGLNILQGTSPVSIGARGSSNPFSGALDEVSLYNRALSAAEIQAIYNAGSAGKCVAAVSLPPNLTAVDSGAAIDIFWPATSGWTLQTNSDLSNPNGWAVCGGVTTSNGTNYLNVVNPTGKLFFRLKSQ